MGGEVPATTNAARTRPEPEPAVERRRWPAALAWSLYALVSLLFAAFPVLDRLARDAGRPGGAGRRGRPGPRATSANTLVSLAVAERTMQPTRASLWLRPPPGSGVA